MKKRIVTLALVVALVAIAAVGTLAYFTDTDTKDNVFTYGKVDITLNDEFEQNSKIYPGVFDGKELKNAVSKEVSVTNNNDSSDAYVRVHIAIPTAIVDNLLTVSTTGNDGWSWEYDAEDGLHHSAPEYEVEIDGVEYTVVTVTYAEKLTPGATTTNVFDYVWLNGEEVAYEDLEALGTTWKIIIYAEGAQAEGFDDAYEALEAAFGTPNATNNPWKGYNNDAE